MERRPAIASRLSSICNDIICWLRATGRVRFFRAMAGPLVRMRALRRRLGMALVMEQEGAIADWSPRSDRPGPTTSLVTVARLARSVTGAFLTTLFTQLGRRGSAGTQGLRRELLPAFRRRKIRPDTGGDRGLLDQPGNLPIRQTPGADLPALTGHPPEQRAAGDPCEFEPGLQCGYGTDCIR